MFLENNWINQNAQGRDFDWLVVCYSSGSASTPGDLIVDLKEIAINAPNYRISANCVMSINTFAGQSSDFEFLEMAIWDKALPASALRNVAAAMIQKISPRVFPTPQPTGLPISSPTAAPTFLPTVNPSPLPTALPTLNPTPVPTVRPSPIPTYGPTQQPSPLPTYSPSPLPTDKPISSPTVKPTTGPTPLPTFSPSFKPTTIPTKGPTDEPSPNPTVAPTLPPRYLCAFIYTKGETDSVPSGCVLLADKDVNYMQDGERSRAAYLCNGEQADFHDMDNLDLLGKISTIKPGQSTTATFYSGREFDGLEYTFTDKFEYSMATFHFHGSNLSNDAIKSMKTDSIAPKVSLPQICTSRSRSLKY